MNLKFKFRVDGKIDKNLEVKTKASFEGPRVMLSNCLYEVLVAIKKNMPDLTDEEILNKVKLQLEELNKVKLDK